MNRDAELTALHAELERLKGELARKEAEIRALNASLQKDKERDSEIEDERRAMICMLEDMNETSGKLEIAKREWEATFDAIADPIFIHDKQYRIVRANRAYREASGITHDEIIGRLYYKVFPKRDGPLEMSLNAGSSQEVFPPSMDKVFDARSYPIRNDKGEYLYSVYVLEDITGRKQAELMLRENEEKFRTLTASASDAIIMMDGDGAISFWNEAAERVFGYSGKEALGNRVSELIIPHRYRLSHIEGLKKFKETGKGPVIGKTVEIEAVRKDGGEFPVELSLSALTLKGRWCAVGILRDISNRVRREEELRLSYKMASLGQLTAGIFHEILNPINIISTHVQLLLADAEKGSGVEKDLKSIQEEIKRVQDITDGFLRFSRKESVTTATSEIDVNQLIDRVLAILVAEIKYKNIHLFRKFDHELPMLKASADSLRQVFLNLIRNAIDAMSNEGSLTISTMKCSKEEKPCLCIQFTDTGCGIPKEHLSKIFDPFFTTKEEGKGVGMGLTVVYTIIQKFGGSVSVSSEVGKGTTFTIELPLPRAEQNKEAG